MKRSILLFVAAVSVFAFVSPAFAAVPVPPGPYTTDAQCFECHDVAANGPVVNTVDFGASPVDRGTACTKCHWIGNPATTVHPFHNAGMSCGACHNGWGRSAAYVPSVEATTGAWFLDASSLRMDGATLHQIHMNPAWPKDKSVIQGQYIGGLRVGTTSYCGSCHAAAACSDCHGDIVHGDHTFDAESGSRLATAVPTVVCAGTPVGDQSVLTASSQPVTCLASTCHDGRAVIASTVGPKTPGATLSGSWSYYTDTRLLSGSAAYSARAATVTISGVPSGSYTWRGFRTSSGGYGRVVVDGVKVAEVNAFGTYSGSVALYTGTLGSGTHTVQIAWTGRMGDYGGSLVPFEALLVSPDPAGFVPTCFECHEDRDDTHGYDPVQHTSSWDAGRCVSSGCHGSADLMPLHTEHDESFTCNTCHRSTDDAVSWSIFVGDGNCSSCHSSAHGIDLAPASTGVARYPGYIWSTPLETSLFAGESWLPEEFSQEGHVIVSNRRTDVAPAEVWAFYRQQLTEAGWRTTSTAPDDDAVSFLARFTYGPYIQTVICYAGETPSSTTPLDAGYKLELLYR